MAKASIQIRMVKNALPEITAEMRPTVVKMVKAHALVIKARAMAKTPVLTGTLRRSITVRRTAGGLTALIGPSVLYGKFVEFGTRRMGARPYMRPAAEIQFPLFINAVKTYLANLKAGKAAPNDLTGGVV